MTRKTVMHRETEVFVVEERLAPRKEAIKRRVKLERCIAAGINLGAMILTGGALVKIGLMVFAVMDSRTGGLGGEVLVFPALAMMFLWGREIGLREARQEAEIKEKRRELESQRAARESGATTTIRQQIAELESQRAAGEAKHARTEAEANKGAYERISNLRYMASTIETDIMHTEQDKREHENEIQRLNRRREQLLAEWNEENEKEWTGSEICPTCGQQLPAEQIEEAKENFNTAKAQNLETINKRGMAECSSGMIKKEQDEIEALDARLVELKEKKAETAKNLATAEKAVLATTDYKGTAE